MATSSSDRWSKLAGPAKVNQFVESAISESLWPRGKHDSGCPNHEWRLASNAEDVKLAASHDDYGLGSQIHHGSATKAVVNSWF